MKILISGFKPFANFQDNITRKLVEGLPDVINGNKIYKIILDVTYKTAFDVLDKEINKVRPDIVIATGLAAARKVITTERIALNINHANAADNAGVTKTDSVIVPGAETALTATLEYPECVYKTDIVVKSYSAGTYVCNDVFYRLLHKGTVQAYPYISFIHFPSEENIPYEKQLNTFVDILSCL
ncbi:MAG TPA: pyroglutamyl-peptidase I [Clostridia bacterium]|jgi:pyroglutamyl-peptidase|nr:pyroglutamyl-peptidase I [Clostridia bacterium]